MGNTIVTAADVIQLALALITFLGGWFVKSLFERVRDLEKSDKEMTSELHRLREDVATNYVTHPRMDKVLDQIFGAIRRIEEKLEKH